MSCNMSDKLDYEGAYHYLSLELRLMICEALTFVLDIEALSAVDPALKLMLQDSKKRFKQLNHVVVSFP